MKLDANEINHNYITRLVIFAVFLFKDSRKREKVYSESIKGFLRRRIQYDISLTVDVGPKMSLDDQRDNVIEHILNDVDGGVLNLIVVNFKTGHKEVNLQINLDEEEKYESYLYS